MREISESIKDLLQKKSWDRLFLWIEKNINSANLLVQNSKVKISAQSISVESSPVFNDVSFCNCFLVFLHFPSTNRSHALPLVSFELIDDPSTENSDRKFELFFSEGLFPTNCLPCRLPWPYVTAFCTVRKFFLFFFTLGWVCPDIL